MKKIIRTHTMSYPRALAVLGALSWLGPFSLDAYTPAFPEMSVDLAVGTSSIQLTLTALLLGLIVGQLIAGPVIEVYGRRDPVLISVALYCVASAACALAPSASALVVLRVVQGLTAAVALVAARAVGRDLFDGTRLAKFYAHIAAVTTLAPLTGPIVGAAIVSWSDWRAIFWLITGLGTACLLAALIFLPNTQPTQALRAEGAFSITEVRPSYLEGYRVMLGDRKFCRYILTLAIVAGIGLTYLAGASFIFQDEYGLSPESFSVLFAANALVLMLGTQTAGLLVGKLAPQTIVTVGLAAQLVVAIGCYAVLTNTAPIQAICILFAILIYCHGLLVPTLTGLAMGVVPAQAGASSALVGVAQFSVGAVTAPILGVMDSGVSVAMGVFLPALSLLAALAFFTYTGSAQYRGHTTDSLMKSACGELDPTEKGTI